MPTLRLLSKILGATAVEAPLQARLLWAATAHWLLHTAAMHQLNAVIPTRALS